MRGEDAGEDEVCGCRVGSKAACRWMSVAEESRDGGSNFPREQGGEEGSWCTSRLVA